MHGKSHPQQENKLTRALTCEKSMHKLLFVGMMHQLDAWNVALNPGAIFGVEEVIGLVSVETASQNTKTLLGTAQ